MTTVLDHRLSADQDHRRVISPECIGNRRCVLIAIFSIVALPPHAKCRRREIRATGTTRMSPLCKWPH